jgi:hypothetical protein
MLTLLYPRKLKNWYIDRKRGLYCLILSLLRSFNLGGFRAAPNTNFSAFLGITCLALLMVANGFADNSRENAIIREAIQEANQNVFSSRSVQLELLKDCPEVIPTLAQWHYDEWHPFDVSMTLEKLEDEFNKYINEETIPFAIVAFKKGFPIGIMSLEEEWGPEFADLVDGDPWVVVFYVIPEERNQGLGRELDKVLTIIANRLGYHHIHNAFAPGIDEF